MLKGTAVSIRTRGRPRRHRRGAVTALVLSLAAGLAGVVGPAAGPANALANGLAPTPPMGFNDWNAAGCSVSESYIEQTAEFIHAHEINGHTLQQDGYSYVNIDDCWAESSRDSAGELVPDPTKFPDGISGTAAYVHGLGLKLGIYTDSGTHTCSSHGFPGSLGHEAQDALQFAEWGVDYIKDDDCNIPTADQTVSATVARYDAMRDAIAAATAKTGHPMVFSICEKTDYGVPNSDWPTVGNLWRTTDDIHTDWTRLDSIIDQNIPLASLAGPGAWNDPDMLEIGNSGLTATEQQTQFSMWAEMAAPLLIGTNLASASTAALDVLANTDVIAIDQDSLGKQGVQVSDDSGLRVLAKPLSNGDVAVAFFNETGSTANISTTAKTVGLPSKSSYILENLWAHTHTTVTTSSWTESVPSHGTVLLRIHA
jgi:alpha-galactosidase